MCLLPKGTVAYVTQEFLLQEWLAGMRRHTHVSTAYAGLIKGPKTQTQIEALIPREHLIKVVEDLITPAAKPQCYPLIIGEHGTGKTSLILLAVNKLNQPKGVL